MFEIFYDNNMIFDQYLEISIKTIDFNLVTKFPLTPFGGLKM